LSHNHLMSSLPMTPVYICDIYVCHIFRPSEAHIRNISFVSHVKYFGITFDKMQNRLSSRPVSRNKKQKKQNKKNIRVYKTIILTLVLFGL
jgi:hypothetical protein